ncbi:hypothetical protein [Paenibacillus sp. 1P07SE]|uniref:hypothetical protein n=1 Tax=Paenibacillus sp. 1P07SE TaxID=3132209 RepID=UPI0039A4BC75
MNGTAKRRRAGHPPSEVLRELTVMDKVGALLGKAALMLLALLLAAQFALQFSSVRQLVTGIDRAEGEPLSLAQARQEITPMKLAFTAN